MNPDNNSFRIAANANRPDAASASSSTEGPIKPKKEPNARKDFKNVLSEEDEESGELISKEELENPKKTSAMSLFGLPTKNSSKKGLGNPTKQELPVSNQMHPDDVLEAANQEVYESPSEVFGKLTSASDSNTKSELTSLSKKDKVNTEYGISQPDISYINPNAPLHPTNEINLMTGAKVEQTTPTQSPIHDIVVELIDKLTIVQTKGQTDTIVTITKPGLFQGTVVVISEFDTAHGQVNLSFENLTAQTKNLLDNMQNREALLVALSQKGYTAPMIITTTQIEHRPIIADQSQAQLGKQQKEGDESGGEEKPKPQR